MTITESHKNTAQKFLRQYFPNTEWKFVSGELIVQAHPYPTIIELMWENVKNSDYRYIVTLDGDAGLVIDHYEPNGRWI